MAIAVKLVARRQRHLKWRALDGLELALMVLCGILLFSFCTTVTFDIITRTIGTLALAAGGDVHAVHLCDLLRRVGRTPPMIISISHGHRRSA
jgi:hypothetical protein